MYLKYSFMFFLLLATCLGASQGIPKVIELDEDNWHEMLDGEWMVEL